MTEEFDKSKPYRLPLGVNLSESFLNTRLAETPLLKKGPRPLGERIQLARRFFEKTLKEAETHFKEDSLMLLHAATFAQQKGLPEDSNPVFRVSPDGLVYLESMDYKKPRSIADLSRRAAHLGVDVSFLGYKYNILERYLDAIEEDEKAKGTYQDMDPEADETTLSIIEKITIPRKKDREDEASNS